MTFSAPVSTAVATERSVTRRNASAHRVPFGQDAAARAACRITPRQGLVRSAARTCPSREARRSSRGRPRGVAQRASLYFRRVSRKRGRGRRPPPELRPSRSRRREAPPHRAPHRRTHILGRTGRFTSPPSAVDRGTSLSPFRVTRGSGGAAKVSLVPTEPLCSPQTQAFSIFPKGRSRSRPFVVSPDDSTSLSRDAETGVVLER